LERNLLPPCAQAVIEPHLEWRLSTSTGQNFRRYGSKGGSLGTGLGACAALPNGCLTILTRTAYAETLQNAPGNNYGAQAVVTIQLRDPAPGSNALQNLTTGVRYFLDALLEDPAFANAVRSRLPDDPPLPDLIARYTSLGPDTPRSPNTLEILKIGTAATNRWVSLELLRSPTPKISEGQPVWSGAHPPLAAGASEAIEVPPAPSSPWLTPAISFPKAISRITRSMRSC
jgi:hypothetical protein